MKINKFSTLYYSTALTLVLSSVIAASETIRPEGMYSVEELRIVDSHDTLSQRLLITDRAGTILVDTDTALPRIENAYSPNSYNGYMVDLVVERQGKLSVTDLQGERYTLLSPSTQAGDYLILITKEEGNSAYNFNLKFKYDNASRSFYLSQILLNENNTECDQALLSSYLIDEKKLVSTSISDFNGISAFNKLKALRLESRTSGVAQEKLMPETDFNNFNTVLQAYKAGNSEKLKMFAGYFIAGGRDDVCNPKKYIVEKYYYPRKVSWSNDLGFLFEQAGYYQEAAELLEHITLRHPDRIVAYLNLADAYWALNRKESARKAYSSYYEKMITAGAQARIPQRVMSRK